MCPSCGKRVGLTGWAGPLPTTLITALGSLKSSWGSSREQLGEFKVPSLPLLLDYAKEANDKAIEFLKGIDDDILDKTVIIALRGEIGMSTMFQ